MAGREDEAFAAFDEAERSSPRDPIYWVFPVGKSFAMFNAERYEDGVAYAAKAREQPNGELVIWPYLNEAICYAQLGRLDLARAAIEAARQIKPDLSVAFFEMALPWQVPELKERFTDALRKAGLPE